MASGMRKTHPVANSAKDRFLPLAEACCAEDDFARCASFHTSVAAATRLSMGNSHRMATVLAESRKLDLLVSLCMQCFANIC